MKILFVVPGIMLALAAGCMRQSSFERRFGTDAPRSTFVAQKTSMPSTLDGMPDESAWTRTLSYPLVLAATGGSYPPKTQKAYCAQRFEPGRVKVLWDDQNLYFQFELEDSDIINDCAENQKRFFLHGDMVEIFIKPEKSPEYCEFYVGPHGNITTLKIESRNYTDRYHRSLLDNRFRAEVKLYGSLNYHRDIDRGWRVAAAIPFKLLEEMTGRKFSTDESWTILLARYNYTRGQAYCHISAYPQLPVQDHHLTEYYAALVFSTDKRR